MKELIKPTVEVLDYTGNGFDDPMWAAKKLVYTKLTRLEQGRNTWDKIHAMSNDELAKQLMYVRDSVRSSWEFVDFTLQLKGVSRGFTHQLVRTRTCSYAQQSQRVVDMSGFDYACGPVIRNDKDMSEWYSQTMEEINWGYERLIGLGAPAQDARGLLPTAVSTSILVKINLRTLADLAAKRDNPRAEGEYHECFTQVANKCIAVMPWITTFMYPPRLETPNLDAMLIRQRGDRSPVEQDELNAAMKELDRLKKVWG